ncbi:MAG: PLDc N-terminal domain-containing protein [Candidatus Hodarchaeales archaeon]|jgi:hypothetical protein
MVDIIRELMDLLWILVPLLIFQITLTGIALWQWSKKKENLGQNKLIWILIILLVNLFGPIIFLMYSQRIDDTVPSDDGTDDWEV